MVYAEENSRHQDVNEERIKFFDDDYETNIAILCSLFEKEKEDMKYWFPDYDAFQKFKENHKHDAKNRYKRIFSLPWILKDVRDLLLGRKYV